MSQDSSNPKKTPTPSNADHLSLSPDDMKIDPPAMEDSDFSNLLSNMKRNEVQGSSKKNNLNLFGADYFTNYEISWLQFNWRVLAEAMDERVPLLERVKFIGIVCSNLDEFFQKRVGGLKRQLHVGVQKLSVDGRTPIQQLKEIRTDVKKMIEAYRGCFFNDLLPALENKGILIRKYSELNDYEKKQIDEYYDTQLYPILTPLAVDQAHPFPFISNQSRSFAIELIDPTTSDHLFARVKIPSNRPRWITASSNEQQITLVEIDDVILSKIDRLFPGAEILSANIFRVTRSADIERNEEEADDLLDLIEEELRERRFAEVVRLEISSSTPRHIRLLLMEKMNVEQADVYSMTGSIGLADAMQLARVDGFNEIKVPEWVPVKHPALRHEIDEEAPSIFNVIKKGDFMVHHPYHSFASSVQHFVEEAAKDPKVLAIKQTLYRTSKDSPLMHALMSAAEDGKQVAVLVELKARFDEERNIEWAQKLEKSGVHVSYGLPGLKIHTKLTIVVREEEQQLRRYLHIGTGNYHPDTAQLYEDIGLFTCDADLGHDVTALFNLLTGFSPDQTYKKLMVAPHFMRSRMTELIDFEIAEAEAGRPGRIIAKMNSLEDPKIIERLYKASQAGVKIDLIVRGVCRLKVGKKGYSENIQVHSVIGRFLEHSRIFYFQHAGQDLYYIGSADWMHRNLDARVEAITPIDNVKLKQYLQFILNVYLRDNRQRWVLQPNNAYERIKRDANENMIASHSIFMKHTLGLDDPVPRS